MPRDKEDDEVFEEFVQDSDFHRKARSLWNSPTPMNTLANLNFPNGQIPTKVKPKARQKWILPGPAGMNTAHGNTAKKPLGRKKFVTLDGGITPDSGSDHKRKTDGPSLYIYSPYKLHKAHFGEKEKRRKDKEKRRSYAKVKSMKWAKLDLRGNPIVTFEPSVDQRQEWIAILDRGDRDGDKRRLLTKLGIEFSRVYTRYRRMWQGTQGHVRNFDVSDDQQHYARRAAQLCIVNGLTPRHLIEYWHANIKDFANSKLKVPPLVFLSSETNVQTVVCAIKKKKWKQGDTQRNMVPTHGFSDVAGLDKRLRAGLERAGHATRHMSDRDLVTIQKAAVAIAKGYKMFISDSMKPLVMWAVENLYRDAK